MMDVQITRSTTDRSQAVVRALTGAGRDWVAAHMGPDAVSFTLPRANVPQVLRSLRESGLQWTRSRGTCLADA